MYLSTPLHLSGGFSYFFRFSDLFSAFQSGENYVSPDVLRLNVCDELEGWSEKILLLLQLNKLFENPVGGKCIVTSVKMYRWGQALFFWAHELSLQHLQWKKKCNICINAAVIFIQKHQILQETDREHFATPWVHFYVHFTDNTWILLLINKVWNAGLSLLYEYFHNVCSRTKVQDVQASSTADSRLNTALWRAELVWTYVWKQ